MKIALIWVSGGGISKAITRRIPRRLAEYGLATGNWLLKLSRNILPFIPIPPFLDNSTPSIPGISEG